MERPPRPALLLGLGPHVRVQQLQQQQRGRRRRHPLAEGRVPPAVTPFVWLVIWVAMSSGFLLGFADGESTLFIDGFQATFFPELATTSIKLPHPQHVAPFCAAMEARVQLYQALPWLATTGGALASGWLAKAHGRRAAIAAGCALFAAGKVLLASAFHIQQIFVAQALSGTAFGLLTQAPMLEVLEVSPWHLRGRLAASISLGRAVGLLCASLLTFGLGLSDRAWGWRLVPLFAIGPALLTLGLLRWLPETSASLVLRGQLAEGRLALARVRGLLASSSTADAEFCDILAAAELSSRSRTQLAVLASEPACWIPLLLSLGMATLVAGSGSLSIPAVNLPLFYALGYGGLQSYAMSLVLVNAGALGGALVALALADTLGRRLGVAACMFAASAAFGSLALLLQLLYGPALAAGGPLPLLPPSHGWAAAVLLMLAHAGCFAGNTTLVWVYVFEVQPLRTRALSTGIIIAALALQMFFWILWGVPLLCHTRGVGAFGLYSVLSAAVALAALLFFVQTVGCPLEQIGKMWQQHRFWRRFFGGRRSSGGGSGTEDADRSFPGLPRDAREEAGAQQQQQQQQEASKAAAAEPGQ